MRADSIRYHFASDNTAAICPEAWAALEEANTKYAPAYGEDEWTAEVCWRIRKIFEVDCDVYFVFTGTAANALGLAQLCQPFHGVICHERAHIQTDEGGAAEFYTRGARLFLTNTTDGRIDLGQAEKLIAQQVELHGHMMRAISVAQATELPAELAEEEEAVADSGETESEAEPQPANGEAEPHSANAEVEPHPAKGEDAGAKPAAAK